MKIYLDNAATTPLAQEVIEEMLPYMQSVYGNPSSIHAYGREARTAIERARKTVATLLNTSPSEIFFTSGGTEADNTIIRSVVDSLGIKHIITTSIEHHAVLHTVEFLEKTGVAEIHYLTLNKKGEISLEELEEKLQQFSPALVSIMHANNEIGNLNDLHNIGNLCRKYNSFFHSDTVQTIGYLPIDLHHTPVDFIVGSAHKFNGPKGVGFMYVNGRNKISPFIHGGAQERNMRGGTENLYGIMGLAKALELSYAQMEDSALHIRKLKSILAEKIREAFPQAIFNGTYGTKNHFDKILSVTFPDRDSNDMILFSLDINGIAISGGSACSSGTSVGSHVLKALYDNEDFTTIRFSFGKQNTEEEILFVAEKLKEIHQRL